MTGRDIVSAATVLLLMLSCDGAFAQGTVWGWGDNTFGQTSTSNSATPTPIAGLTDVVAVAAGLRHSLALKSDGTVWAWGLNANGQLGNGVVLPVSIFDFVKYTPAQVLNLTGVTAIAARGGHSRAVKADGT